MEDSTIHPSYLINDPQHINSLKPDHVPKSPRRIDHGTLVDLTDITQGVLNVLDKLSGTAVFQILADPTQALMSILRDVHEGKVVKS